MYDVDVNDYTIMQLREWLRSINLPTSGNKSALVLRLNAVAPNIRGNCPSVIEAEEENDDGQEENENDAVCENQEAEINVMNAMSRELELIKKEMALVAREKELLQKENEILKRAAAVDSASSVALPFKNDFSFTTLKDLVPEYDGGSSIDLWVSQLLNVGKMYALSDDVVKALMFCKLKGRAQVWLHSKPDYVSIKLDILIGEMQVAFKPVSGRLQQRRQFENRKWNYGESFSKYFNDKLTLASGLQLVEAELVDHMVEGITDAQLRTQAILQCFENTDKLLRAFSRIELCKPLKNTIMKNDREVRCFNCNSAGHIATDCRKPKRTPGSCFGCGSVDHRIARCPKNKILTLEAENYDEYVINVNMYLFDSPNIFLSAECLIDSGSPVNFVKIKIIKPTNIKMEYNKCNELTYFGLNKTKLIIFGKIVCFVKLNGEKVKFDVFVVANDSMGYDAVLGRDFMKKAKIILVPENNITKLWKKSVKMGLCSKSNNYENEKIMEKESKFYDNESKLDRENVIENLNIENIMKIEISAEKRRKNYEKAEKKNVNSRTWPNKCDKNNICKENILIKKENEMLNEIFFIDCEKPNLLENLHIGDNIDIIYKQKLSKLFQKYFINSVEPKEPGVKCEMKLFMENPKPFHFPVRRLSFFEKNKLQELLDEYLEKGFIRSSSSEYASAIVLVKKKTGDLRMCVDFRALNKMTCRDNYPLPMIDDLLDKLANKNYFTKLDLKNGYFHVFMHKDSIKYTSFVTPIGQFEWLRMPFGLRNAPSVFQRYVNEIFADMIKQNELIIYMDDILIATHSVENHLSILEKVFKRAVENKLQFRIDKCKFMQEKIKYLGYSIDKNGISPDEKGVNAVINFPTPQNSHEVQRFLGLGSYFRRFIQNFSLVAKPLYDLLKKDRKFSFGEREQQSFETIKDKLSKYPILAIYDPKDEVELHCDASSTGFGAILLQKKSDNKWHPIFYFSKRTTVTESKYHSFELETLAIVYALKRFRIYLYGKPFKIVTDCNSLKQTLSKKELNPRIARWALELQNFEYSLEHRANTRMQHVDALSRISEIMILETNTFEENLIICQNKDKNLCEIKKMLEKSEHKLYELRNGVVYKKVNKEIILFYVPEAMENHVLYKYHDELAHLGVNKTIETIKQNYWFPNMRKKVEEHISNCLKCIAFSEKHGKEEGYIHNIPKSTVPFDIIHVDHFGPVENGDRSKKYIFVVIDGSTKFVRLYATKTT